MLGFRGNAAAAEGVHKRRRFSLTGKNKELISNISHDLKTPITAVKRLREGIMDGVADTPEKMDRYIKTIYNKANDMDRLINELTFLFQDRHKPDSVHLQQDQREGLF